MSLAILVRLDKIEKAAELLAIRVVMLEGEIARLRGAGRLDRVVRDAVGDDVPVRRRGRPKKVNHGADDGRRA